jgi:hypothetical protein
MDQEASKESTLSEPGWAKTLLYEWRVIRTKQESMRFFRSPFPPTPAVRFSNGVSTFGYDGSRGVHAQDKRLSRHCSGRICIGRLVDSNFHELCPND